MTLKSSRGIRNTVLTGSMNKHAYRGVTVMSRITDHTVRLSFALAAIVWTLVSLQWYVV